MTGDRSPDPPKAFAILLAEYSTLPDAFMAADLAAKNAYLDGVDVGSVDGGNGLLCLLGGLGDIESAERAMTLPATDTEITRVVVADVHRELGRALLRGRSIAPGSATLLAEGRGVPALVRGADEVLKGCSVDIATFRIAEGIDGKAFLVLSGSLQDVEAAAEQLRDAVPRYGGTVTSRVIAQLTMEVATALSAGASFTTSSIEYLDRGTRT